MIRIKVQTIFRAPDFARPNFSNNLQPDEVRPKMEKIIAAIKKYDALPMSQRIAFGPHGKIFSNIKNMRLTSNNSTKGRLSG
jgi:hypothetical protein